MVNKYLFYGQPTAGLEIARLESWSRDLIYTVLLLDVSSLVLPVSQSQTVISDPSLAC